MKKSLDIVIPCFNESKSIIPLIQQVEKDLKDHFQFSLIFIDDGSKDNTHEIMKMAIEAYHEVPIKYLKLTRNFGKEIAVKCGIDQSTAELCAIMDGDLQHPPVYLIKAAQELEDSGASIVYITPIKRLTYAHQKIGTFFYRKLLDSVTNDRVYLTDFSVFNQKTVNLIKQYNESDFYTRGILCILGLKSSEIKYVPEERKYGKSTFSLRKLVNLAIGGVLSVSTKPLRLAIYVGLIVSFFSIMFGIFLLVEKIFMGQPIPGFATLGFGMFFIGGIQILFLGVIGEYVGKTFIQSKQRPIYTIDEVIDQCKDAPKSKETYN